MPSLHITPSGGLLTHQFIEAIQQQSFNHPAAAPETFALPGQKAPSPAELERAIGAAWELLVERWDSIERDLPGMDISTLRERWIRPLFGLLDISLEYQRADLLVDEQRPDGGLRFPISHVGLPLGAEYLRLPVHNVLPHPGGLDVRPDSGSGLRRLAPHDLLQRYLNLNHATRWGLLTDGLHLRLLRDYHHTYTRGYVEFDLQGLFSGRDYAAFRALYRLCHASRFIPLASTSQPAPATRKPRKPAKDEEEEPGEVEEITAQPNTPLDSFYEHALATGVKVGEDLRNNVQVAIETIANGFLQATPGLLARLQTGEHHVSDLYSDILHTIYRVLFLLFAEQRGMFPGRGSLYMEEYSLTALRSQAERPPVEDPHSDLWERLKATFSMVEKGVPALGIFGYNGALFARDKTSLLTPPDSTPSEHAPQLRNDALLAAIRALTTVEQDRVLQRISYADLSVEEIGSVYESLLDYTPRIAETPEQIEGRAISPGTFYLDPRGMARKSSGSYYTHPSLVNELIRSALVPVLDERLSAAVQAAGGSYDLDHPESLTPAQRQAAEDALLALNVVDPAAGSGAFLIAADNVLGLRLAQLRSGDLYPPERAVRRARRDALAQCIYAVDLNPMAVELCKLSLWINAVVEDQPLNFLDHHIKVGNSLVGATRKLLAQGIPSEAYGGASGDDPALTRAARQRNDQERAGQLNVLRIREIHSHDDLRRWRELESLAQSDPKQAEQRYHELHAQGESSPEHLACDLWTAAFFWPLTAENDGRTLRERAQAGIFARAERRTPPPPTTQDIRQALAGPARLDQEQRQYARGLAQKNHFFHWELEFPDVFTPGEEDAGFDVVLGNPPWERIKLQEKEFFSDYDPAIANAPNAAARRALIADLPRTNPAMWQAYSAALRAAEQSSNFLRGSGRYPLTGTGDINTYQVFAEHARDLVAPGGRAGVILPSGIATDYTNRDFFASLVEQDRLRSLFDFENRRKLFPDVDSRMKFCLLTITTPRKGEAHQLPAEFAFFLYTADELHDPQRRFNLTVADFALLNPNTRTCPIFRSRQDAELTRKLYRAAPVLVNEATGENPWGVTLTTMFHMTNDSALFRTYEQLSQAGFRLKGNRFEKEEEVWLPLYEAKMFHQFDHRWATFNGRQVANLPIAEKVSSERYVYPRYWINKFDRYNRLRVDRHSLLAFRDIARATDERTAIFSFIPLTGVGNTAPLIFSNHNITSITSDVNCT